MPPEERKELAAARTNTLLLRYVILLGVFIGLIILEIGIVYVVIGSEKSRNESTIRDNEAKTVEYGPTKIQAQNFRSDLSTAKYILDKQVSYTTLMLALANGLPEGALLNQLNLDAASFGTASTLTVRTTSYEKSIDIKKALQNIKVGDKPLFTTVSFDSVSSSGNAEAYPLTAVFTVNYSKAVLQQ